MKSEELSREVLAEMDVHEALRMSCLPTQGRAKVKAEVIAARLRMPAGTFGNLMSGVKKFLADDVAAVVHATGDYLVMHVLAAKCGGSFHCESDSGTGYGRKPLSVVEAVQRELVEHADFHREVLSALEDGEISEVELRRIDREAAEHLASLGELRNALAARKAKAQEQTS